MTGYKIISIEKPQFTSPYFVYELKGFIFLISECYGNAEKGTDNTTSHNFKPTATYMDSGKGTNFIQ